MSLKAAAVVGAVVGALVMLGVFIFSSGIWAGPRCCRRRDQQVRGSACEQGRRPVVGPAGTASCGPARRVRWPSVSEPTARSPRLVGFDPEITLGVWVGYDEKKTLGNNEQGSRVALPIWLDFMRAYIDGRYAADRFVPPANIVHMSVNPTTGEVTEPWAAGTIRETFIAGTEPGATFGVIRQETGEHR